MGIVSTLLAEGYVHTTNQVESQDTKPVLMLSQWRLEKIITFKFYSVLALCALYFNNDWVLM